MANFYKYQAAGNDFILFDNFKERVSSSYIRSICDRHYGIGADGLLLLEPSIISDAKMRIFNADGVEASMCGNGLRCVIRHLNQAESTIETKAGISLGKIEHDFIHATFPRCNDILSPLSLPFNLLGYYVDTGTEHLVVIVKDFEDVDFLKVAPILRSHPLFSPRGVNVNFIKLGKEDIEIRTYEKGVEGETLACGTGCAAAAFVLQTHFNYPEEITLRYPTNEKIHIYCEHDRLWMLGDAKLVFTGKYLSKNSTKGYTALSNK